MKKRIAILGSTGSIGENTLKIIKQDKKNFEITLLSTNKNLNKILKQAKEFKVKNIIISDLRTYQKAKSKINKSNFKIYNNFDNFKKIFRKKNNIIMSSITGLSGLGPTLKSIRFTKKILIANKEAIICGWNLIDKELKKYNTKFIPVDSEHFSIWSLLQNNKTQNIDKIYITASGGPFLKLPLNKFSKISVKKALKHPNWKMGKKISIDSATMMNKLFEIIEAKNIFNLEYKKIFALIHPKSYVHAIIKFKNGITKILIHETSMRIPIFNALYYDDMDKKISSKEIDISTLNNLNFSTPDKKRFKALEFTKILPNKISLFETILVTANDEIVKLFLKNKISFQEIVPTINKIIKFKDFKKFKKIIPKNLNNIAELSKFVRFKIQSIVYKSS